MEFVDRLDSFADAAGRGGVVLLVLVCVIIPALALARRHWWLLAIFVGALMFAGFENDAIDSGSVLLRWLIMFVLAVCCMYGMKSPGPGAIMLSSVAVIGILTAPLAPDAMWALQFSGLFLILTFPMAASIGDRLRSMPDVTKFLRIVLVCAGIWVVLQMFSLRSIVEATRFEGAGKTPGAFAFTGGLMLPVALWGVLGRGPIWWRLYCGVTGILILLLIALSGSRTGTFSGVIACLPLLVARFGVRKILLGTVVIALGVGLAWGVLTFMPAHKEFLLGRYISTDTSGRVERWAMALDECLESPLMGDGVGADKILGYGPHNTYLIIWLTHGLLGLMLFVGALTAILFQSLKLVFGRMGDQAKEIGRLFCGITMGSMIAGFFVGKMNSSSNVVAFFVVMSSVIVHRTTKIARGAADTVGEFGQSLESIAGEYEFEKQLRQYYG